MCPVKSPSAQSSNPSTPPSKHARRPSLTIQQRQQQQQQQESQLQYSAESLARHGIKVRDFAYESDLPLIPSIPRVRQLSLAGRPLKRTKRQSEQPDNDVFGIDSRPQSQSDMANPFRVSLLELDHDNATTGGIPNKSKPLERRSTEPAIIPERIPERQRQRPFRDVGYADLSQHASGSQPLQKSPLSTPTSNRFRTFSPTALPFPFPATFHGLAEGSQGTDLSIDTPLATPKGSLTWPTITSDVPASQLDGYSQPPAVEDMTYSQLGFSAPSSQALNSNPDLGGTDDPLSPSSPRPTEPASSPSRPPPRRLNGARASSPPSPSPRNRALRTPTRPAASTPGAATTPRYFLRKRSTPAQAPASPASPHRKRVSSSSKVAARYPGRIPAMTRQAAHATVSGSGGRSSHARPLRKTTLS
ncbi:hypothetical protein EDB92DRAFT_1004997 [Lactarius akahatsu]|uniref:Uncharacterized protein n=1 Tax=Lactarius akahatsu TaxID=416441 RepID=A0AAD4LEA5_9AGAM|nr:hypothetical protein EDB92DRAFT_1004997 [Lactarius akahatsu]